ncbi:MAG: Gfo/Idh/MocA family oxidoreductase [Alphaproteobacteria bacterium]|jgi:predicted dehydrogenase|nr:Gfo/Idh/MocA family oxidoreductase [Alphaproteobacteria bacterium]
MKDHVIGVLGLGSIGMRHARNLLALNCDVIGFDPDQASCDRLVAGGGLAVADRQAVIEAAEAVVIATPNGSHADDLAAVIGAGRSVFAEKPLAHSDADIAGLLENAAAKGITVFAAFMLRYHPVVERMRMLIDGGAVGQVWGLRAVCGSWLPGWRPAQDYRLGYAADPVTGGVINDIVHEIDLACHLLGYGRVASCVARRSGLLDMESEDVADLVLVHESGASSNLHLDYLARPPVRRGSVSGSQGTLVYDLNARTLCHLDADGAEQESMATPGAWADDYVAEMRDFLDCLGGLSSPRCDGIEALQVLTTTLQARSMAGLPQ